MSREITATTSYSDKIVKLIPAEIIGAYLAVQNLVVDVPQVRERALLIAFSVLLLLTPLYLRRVHDVRSVGQIIVTMISFAVWALAITVPITSALPLGSVEASVILILWTSSVPVLTVRRAP